MVALLQLRMSGHMLNTSSFVVDILVNQPKVTGVLHGHASCLLHFSNDGSIKIWDENKILISEFTLDDTLNAACFLGDAGDVVMSFKNHIFFIDRRKGKISSPLLLH